MNASKSKFSKKAYWVAVKVERGFVSKVQVCESEGQARTTERKWKISINPDYDEVAVVRGPLIRRSGKSQQVDKSY